MNTGNNAAVKAYQTVGVEGKTLNATPHQLILLLFEGAVQAVAKARLAMQRNDVKTKCEAISKAMAIIQDGLQLSLDRKAGGEIAENLNSLYDYMIDRLLTANLNNQPEVLDEVGRLLLELKGAWKEIGGKVEHPSPTPAAAEAPDASRSTTTVSYGKA